ncbi:hypothetical protein EJB05_02965, partial [Eragrostis curvula]
MLKITVSCLEEDRAKRPNMCSVVQALISIEDETRISESLVDPVMFDDMDAPTVVKEIQETMDVDDPEISFKNLIDCRLNIEYNSA